MGGTGIDRFPPEFMFQLTQAEYDNLMSQFATSSWGGRHKLPFALPSMAL